MAAEESNPREQFLKEYSGKTLGELEEKNGHKIGKHYNGVTCIVIDAKTGKIMIVRRQNKGLTPGKLDLVSGHVDNDETPTQAIIRELIEKIGMPKEEAKNVKLIDMLPLSFASKGEQRNFFIHAFCLIKNFEPGEQINFQEKEVQEVFFLPMEEAFRMIREGETKFPKRDMYENIFSKVKEAYEKTRRKFLKAYNADGQPIGYLEAEKESKIGKYYLNGVTCFVIDAKTGKIMIERRQNKGLTPGKLDLVSGHVDNNEAPTQAIIRELMEEIGMPEEEAIKVKTIDMLPLSFASKGEQRNFFIYFFCLIKKFEPGEQINFQEKEVQEVFFLPMEEAFRRIREGETKFPKGYMYEPIFLKVIELYEKTKNPQLSNNGINRE